MGCLCIVVELQNILVTLLTILVIGYSECLSIILPQLSGMPKAYFLRHILFSSLSYFYYSCHKQHDFREKKKILKVKSVFLFYIRSLSETFLILSVIQRDIIIPV